MVKPTTYKIRLGEKGMWGGGPALHNKYRTKKLCIAEFVTIKFFVTKIL